jgi:hypothetical protein
MLKKEVIVVVLQLHIILVISELLYLLINFIDF